MRQRVRLLLLSASLLAIASLVSSARAGESCPTSQLVCYQDFSTFTDDTGAPVDSIDCGTPGQTARDRFVVSGLPPGPVAFSVRLHVIGAGHGIGGPGDSGGMLAHLRRSGVTPADGAWGTFDGFVTIDNEIALALFETVNLPFEIEYVLESVADYGGFGNGTAALTFSGLPQGAHVSSCQGYAADSPVPAHAASWGKVKGTYR